MHFEEVEKAENWPILQLLSHWGDALENIHSMRKLDDSGKEIARSIRKYARELVSDGIKFKIGSNGSLALSQWEA